MTSDIKAKGSIRRRLMVQLLSGSAILAIALFFIIQGLARQLAEESQDNILAASAATILDAASIRQGQVQLDLPYSAFSMLSNLSNDRVFYAIHFGGDFLTGYDDLLPVINSQSFEPQFATRDYRTENVRLVTASRRLSVNDRPVTVAVTLAQTRDGQRELLAWVSQVAAGLGAGFFLSVALLAIFTARSSITPMSRLADSVGRRGAQDLRPVAAPVPTEMVPLVRALNRFMERLKNSLTRSEEFIADAAHRVRTPLATVRAQAEITYRRVDKEENRASIREMIRAIDESSRAAGQLLDHATVTFRADNLEQSEIDLSSLATEMVDRLQPMADLRDINLNLSIDEDLKITGDAILVQSALRNLLENAIKYSPSDSAITLYVTAVDGKAQLIVRDQGIGFPSESPEQLTGRFRRGSNVGGVVGSGLGLTIAEEVVNVHGGRLIIANNQKEPGACVTLSFPLS